MLLVRSRLTSGSPSLPPILIGAVVAGTLPGLLYWIIARAGLTWLAADAAAGLTTPLWAGTDTMGSTGDISPTAVPVLDGADLAALRGGAHTLTKHFTLPVHHPLSPQNLATFHAAVIVTVDQGGAR